MKLSCTISDKDHYQGNKNAPLQLLEYGDFQCNHCKDAYYIIKSIQKVFGDKLVFIFRNFPLNEVHPDAYKAAIAAEASAQQGKFWEMHDLIYENQSYLSWNDLFKYASKTGINMERFENDVQDSVIHEKVDIDFENGIRSGVNGTPSFYINGEKYERSWKLEDLEDYIQNLL